jgi:probable phosphoglycerate mutase
VEIVFIRHGEPDWTPDACAVNDPGLTDLGHAQARRVAERYGAAEFDHLWVSPARRARETAAPVSAALGMTPVVHDWLVEAGTPDWEGASPEAVREVLIGGRSRGVSDWWDGLPGGESLAGFVQRIGRGFDAVLADLGGERDLETDGVGRWRTLPREGRVLAVCHAGTIGASVSHLLGLPQVPWAWERFFAGHATATRLATTPIAAGAIFSLRTFGDRAHLEGLETRRDAVIP